MITSGDGWIMPLVAKYPAFVTVTGRIFSLQGGRTVSSFTSTLQDKAVSPGVQQDKVFPFNPSVSLLRSNLQWWESMMSWPRIASICISMTMILWIMGTPSKTKVSSAIPAMSKDDPPTPETLVLVLCRAGRLDEGILLNEAKDKTVTVAHVSIKKLIGVPSTCPWIKMPFSQEPGPGIGDASEDWESWLLDELDEEKDHEGSSSTPSEKDVTLTFLWWSLSPAKSMSGSRGTGLSCPTKPWPLSLMGESFPDGVRGFLSRQSSFWDSRICNVPSHHIGNRWLLP